MHVESSRELLQVIEVETMFLAIVKVPKEFGHSILSCAHTLVEGRYSECSANNDKEVTAAFFFISFVGDLLKGREVISRQSFAKENDIWLDKAFLTVFVFALHDRALVDVILECLCILPLFAESAVSTSVGSMSLSYLVIHVHTSLLFEVINILSQIELQNTFVLEELDEVVSGRGLKLLGIQELLGKLVEGFRRLIEEVQREDGLRSG